MRAKISKQPPPAPTTSAAGPRPTVIQIVGRPGTGSTISLDKGLQALAGIVNFSFSLCLVNLHCAWSICLRRRVSLKTKGLSIGRFYQLFVFVHRLSVVEVISLIGIINFCFVLAWSFCLQKHVFLKTKGPSIGCFFLCISLVLMSQELSISFFVLCLATLSSKRMF